MNQTSCDGVITPQCSESSLEFQLVLSSWEIPDSPA